MRLQLALNVKNLPEAIEFYGKLFDAEPHKQRPGYANFAIENPPLKLVLFENPAADERLNHLGVEVHEQNELDSAADRLRRTGILSSEQTETICCHATQNKAWSQEPQGLSWEWYRITDDNPVDAETPAGGAGRDKIQEATDVCCA
jgi:catechol-2,3-dioxygenase